MARISVLSFGKYAVIVALLLVALAAAQTRNRIQQRIEDSEHVVVAGAHPMAQPEFDQGRVDAGMRIDRSAMVFKLSAAQQRALEKLLAEQQDPASANYRKWLTPEQYAERFGMSEDDLAKVSIWLKSQGLTVEGYSRGRTQVFFSGSAAQVESVFRTEFHRYLVNGEMHFANATELSAPSAFSGMVLSFQGLDDFRPKPRVRAVKPNFTSHQSGNHFVAPGDFATIYNLKPLYDAGLDGTGEKIAVVGQTLIAANNSTTDLDAFRAASGLPKNDPQFLLVPGTGTAVVSSGDQVEADLDIEWSNGVAKNASVVYVYVGNGTNKSVWDALHYSVDNNLAPVISISYGNCEAGLPTGFPQTVRGWVQQANLQGQTVVGPSGDSGAADCESRSSQSATHGLAVDVPASIPEVTGVGGSEFTGDAAGALSGTPPNTDAAATTFWGGTTNATDNLNSALSYIPEMAWNNTTASIAAGGGLSASGGGVSTVFSKPSWQIGVTPPNDSHRDVPDVSLNGAPNHDGSLFCSQDNCVSGFRASNGSLNVVGGTSVSVPTFAGIVAILNQASQSGGLGNINPTLYSLAVSKPSAFHDITTGNNIVPCTSGTPTTGSAALRCPTTAPFQIGYSAVPGYDLLTGLGSINANVLATSWPGFVVTPDFSVGGTPISISAPGKSGTSTITVSPTNGFSGTVDLTCVASSLPAGATCAFAPTSVTSGTSILTIASTAATPVATSNVMVTGTSGSVSHTTSVSLTISAPTSPDFTIAATPLSPATISAGASSTSTITITSMNGFSGNVTLSCSIIAPSVSPAPSCSFNPGSVANGSGTATLMISTTAPHLLSGMSALLQRPRGFGWVAASGSAMLVGVFLLGVPSRRRRRVAGLSLMLLVFFAAGIGCGGGSSSGGGGKTGGTPSGSYTITVTATSASPQLSHAVNVAVTVQ